MSFAHSVWTAFQSLATIASPRSIIAVPSVVNADRWLCLQFSICWVRSGAAVVFVCGADDEVAVTLDCAQPTVSRGIARIAAARILTPRCR